MKTGDKLDYHGRIVEVIEVRNVSTPSGDTVGLARVKDPKRGQRVLFVSQLEVPGIEPAPHRDEDFRSFR